MMEGGCVAELMDVATLMGGVLDDEVGGVPFLQGEGELRSVAEVAEGTNGLASTLRADLTAAGVVDKVEVGVRSGVLMGTEMVFEVGMAVSSGVDFVRGAVTRQGVLLIALVVCMSGVKP